MSAAETTAPTEAVCICSHGFREIRPLPAGWPNPETPREVTTLHVGIPAKSSLELAAMWMPLKFTGHYDNDGRPIFREETA